MAQKKFKDPKRQSLEERKQNIFKAKKLWNGYLKSFREELKETQALLNGRVEGGERIRIDQPLPEETAQSLFNLSEKFQKRVEEGNQIYQAQGKYSEDYKNFFSELETKRMEKVNKLPNAPQAQKEASLNYNLISQAGIGPLGLFWETLKSFFSSNEEARRVTLLKQISSIDSEVSKTQRLITSARDSATLEKIRKKMYDLYRKLRSIIAVLEYSEKLSKKEIDGDLSGNVDGESKNQTESLANEMVSRVKAIKEDMGEPFNLFRVRGLKRSNKENNEKIEDLYVKIYDGLFSLEKNPNNLRRIDEIINNYNDLLMIAFNGGYQSFKDYKDFSGAKEASIYEMDMIIKMADSAPYDSFLFKFKKWLSSMGLKLNVFLKIRSNLIDCSSYTEDVRQNLNECINDLKSNQEVNYSLIRQSLKESSSTLEQSVNTIDSLSLLIGENGISDEKFNKLTQAAENSAVKSFFSFFKKKDRGS